jgi:hypothetical protein
MKNQKIFSKDSQEPDRDLSWVPPVYESTRLPVDQRVQYLDFNQIESI